MINLINVQIKLLKFLRLHYKIRFHQKVWIFEYKSIQQLALNKYYHQAVIASLRQLNCNWHNIHFIFLIQYILPHQTIKEFPHFMTHYQQKEQNYTKWHQSIWISVQKEISLFQKKVTDCMLQLGDISKKQIKDFQIQPCLQDDVILGQQFYIELIRPTCVTKGYLPKKIPTQEDVADIRFAQQQQRIKLRQQSKKDEKEDKKKQSQKKGGKKKQSKGPSNQQKMKIKIVKDNFQKDIQLVIKSHSMERMQVQFGLKHKKLQMKLMTFFYVAYFIRKNKVSLKIDDSQIFQLVNILIKIVRIFSHFYGKSFIDNSKQIQLSATLILDLKCCIKGLKDYYKYDNNLVMIKYPKLVYYTNYDKFFPTLDIKPYDSQITFIQSVKKALNQKSAALTKPTLILYKTMIGSGKTSASIALSQLVNECKLVDDKNSKMQVLYSCLIGSVRVQVGRYAYNKKQKFALAAMERSIKNETYFYPRIINSWSCRNQKSVDLVISDLYCTYQMLDHHYLTDEEEQIIDHQKKNRKQVVNVGKLDRQNIVLFIDQPTAFCKDQTSKATRKLFDILANYPPRLTILASATMPEESQLSKTIQLIKRKNPDLQVFQVESQQFQIGCQYCSFKGQIIFPHTGVKTRAQLTKIIELLKRNAFLMRLYTGPSLFHLTRKCQEAGMKNLPDVNKLPQIRQKDIIAATFKILQIVAKQNDDFIEEVCKLSKEVDNIDFKQEVIKEQSDDQFDFMQQEKDLTQIPVERQDYVNFKKMLKGDAHKFLGGCLIGTADPIKFAQTMFNKWVRKIKPIKRLMQKYQKEFQQLDKQIRLLEEDKQMRQQKKTKQISKIQAQKEPTLDFPQKKKINTSQHYNRYCKNKETTHNSMLIKPVPLQNVGKQLIQQADDFVLKLLFCGVAIYAQSGLSAKYLDKVQELASQNFLAYIITDQSLCYGTNFPISNVILRDDLATKLNMNEMFQFIGRAGRVGQSWTARAFLQPEGLKKLNNYIHIPECQVSEQAKIFQTIAQQHLNYPLLRLRTIQSQIRYLDNQQNSQFIQILIKKKNIEDSHLFKKIALVPFNKCQDHFKVLSQKLPLENVNYYNLPSSQIAYEDMPKIKNAKGQDIIDVASYFNNQQKYIQATISNTVERIIKQQLGAVISRKGQINKFQPKVYEDFFNKETNTFVILIECEQGVQFQNYKLYEYKQNQFANDDIMGERLSALIRQATVFRQNIIDHPSGIVPIQVKNMIELHKQIYNFEKFKFYRQYFNHYLPAQTAYYYEIIQKVPDKDILQCRQQSVTILAISKCGDTVNYGDKYFHVDKNARSLWVNICKKVNEEKK